MKTTRELYQPYLQVNHLGKAHGLPENRTIAANGSFSMKINSCEYFNATESGDYNITTNNGYLWFSSSIFDKFVTDLYTLRSIYPKTDPLNLVCKLALNSLYGRFAMRPHESITEFIPRSEEILEFLDKNVVEDWIDIDKENFLLTYRNTLEDGALNLEYNNSIAIASAITAYARVFIINLKIILLLIYTTQIQIVFLLTKNYPII